MSPNERRVAEHAFLSRATLVHPVAPGVYLRRFTNTPRTVLNKCHELTTREPECGRRSLAEVV
jgi:hypothetical protein